jgi:hypothetical protein
VRTTRQSTHQTSGDRKATGPPHPHRSGVYGARFPKGKGKSSNWRLSIKSLVRSEEAFPAVGVPFALLLTISDLKGAAPVFNDLRLHLTTRNVQIADIRVATQVRIQP